MKHYSPQHTLLFITLTCAVFIIALSGWFYVASLQTLPPHVIQSTPTLPDKQTQTELKMLFLGDMMLDRHVGEKIAANSVNYLFDKLDKSIFEDKQLVAANLEGAVTDGGKHLPPVQSYDFAFHPQIIQQLHDYGFTFFNLANNHLTDQGDQGMRQTYQNLKQLDFGFSGCADAVVNNDCSYSIVTIDNYKLGMVGLSMVYHQFNFAQAQQIITDLLEQTDIIIVNIHWGVEYQHEFNTTQQQVAHQLIDVGADIIIGHHPHVIQGMEIYNHKPIFYSLGNFIFDQYFSADTQQGLGVAITIVDDKTQIFTLIPFSSHLSQVELVQAEDKQQLLDDFVTWSNLSNEMSSQVSAGSFTLFK